MEVGDHPRGLLFADDNRDHCDHGSHWNANLHRVKPFAVRESEVGDEFIFPEDEQPLPVQFPFPSCHTPRWAP